jgi:hypothetical protein
MPAPANLVHQTSTTTGTGNLTVAAVNGKQTFSNAFGTGVTTNVFDYFISNQGALEYERGTGHMSNSTTLVRDTVIESTNANAAVSFSAGTKDVVNDVPANRQESLTNVRNAKTANYTLVNSDKGSTLSLGGSTLFTLTVSAASGYDANFSCIILNEDTSRGKLISINGYSSFILWPGQNFILINQNNIWQFRRPGRWVLTASTTFNVNHASGVDANNDGLGSGSGAFATIQNAGNVVQAQIDCNGFQVTIQNVNETFTENVTFNGRLAYGANNVMIQGNNATPSSCVWQTTGTALASRDHCCVVISGFKLVGTGSGRVGLMADQLGILGFQNIDFGTFTSGVHINIDGNSAVSLEGGTYTVSGNCLYHIDFTGPGWFVPVGGQTVSVPNALTFTVWLQMLGSGGFFDTTLLYSGTGAGAGSTGQKYNVSFNATAVLNGTTLPGASAGATSSGGQVSP